MKEIRTRVSRDGQRVTARDGDGNRVTIPVPNISAEAHRSGEWVHVMISGMDAKTRRELERLSNGACNPVEVA